MPRKKQATKPQALKLKQLKSKAPTYKRKVAAASVPKAKPAGAPASFATVIGQMKAQAPKAKPAASQARLKAAAMKSMSGQRMKAPNMGLVKSAMPKAKAQRTAAEIAAMHAYRAAGGGQKRRAPGPSFPVKRRKGGHKKPPKSTTTTRSLPYKSSTSGPYR